MPTLTRCVRCGEEKDSNREFWLLFATAPNGDPKIEGRDDHCKLCRVQADHEAKKENVCG